jgi:hypothetical protein
MGYDFQNANNPRLRTSRSGWPFCVSKMNKQKTRSVLAVIQFLALIQIIICLVVIPHIWKSGQSSLETHIQMGGEDAVKIFRKWLEKNLHVTRLWTGGIGCVTFFFAGVSTLILCRNKKANLDDTK